MAVFRFDVAVFRFDVGESQRPSARGRAPMGRWARAHGAVGDRPWADGRSPTGRWALTMS